MSLDKLQKLIGSMAKIMDGNEKLAAPFLLAKLNKQASVYPHDQTIGMISRVVGDLIDHNTIFISRADFKSLYNKFYSHGTKFAELFQEELGESPPESTVQLAPSHDESNTFTAYQVEDQVLANALESVFDNRIPLKNYSKVLSEKALQSVASILDAWSLRPNNLSIKTGNDQYLVVQADYDTPKGLTSFYIPVEIQNNKIVDASVFIGNGSPQDLNHNNIKSYVTSLSGAKLKITADDVLNVLTKAASQHREVSSTELAVTRLIANRQGKSTEFAQNQVLGQKMVEYKPDVKLPRLAEADTFEEKFNTARGLAAMQFSDSKVNTAREHIARELTSFGYHNPKIVVTGHDKQTIFYGVSVDTGKTAFTVPVKITEGKLNKPTFFLCSGSLSPFNRENVAKLISENRLDVKVAAVASSMANLKPSEVIGNLRQALEENNYAKAEDALNVLANSNDEKAYAIGFQIYLNGLAGHKQAKSTCTHLVKSSKTSVSEHAICSQTGLPTNKIYQDKNGNCRPLFRKSMDETYEGAVFNNAKIFG